MPPFAPVQLSEQQNESQQTSETFRGPEFGEELARSRDLSQNFPSEILQFLAPLLAPFQRSSARGRENLQDVFRRSGGSKSSFAGQRFSEFERDASLNEILGLTKGAQSFFGPLAALQQNRLAVAGSPLSRSQGSTSGSSRSFGFPPESPQDRAIAAGNLAQQQADIARRQGTIDFLRPSGGGGSGSSGVSQSPSPTPFPTPAPAPTEVGTSFLDPAQVGSGGGGGGGIFFDPATGLAQSTPQAGFNVAGGFDSTGGFNNDFGFNDFEFGF